MDEDVARLAREERLVEAAELALSRGDARTASALFERACDFRRAAENALRSNDFARAIPLALEAKAPELAEAAIVHVTDVVQAEKVAYQLDRRGDLGWSGRVLEKIGKKVEAARAYERGGEALRAAQLLEATGDVIGAAKALEAQIRRQPENATLLVALGSLLHRYGKTDAAVRALQRVKEESPERRAALTILVQALDRLGLAQAKLEADAELGRLGGPLEEALGNDAAALSVRARLFGRYEIVREVASSPHARVIECIDGVRSEHVAVKVFAGYDARGSGRDALARFEREVRVLGTLDHPNILPLREYIPEGPALVLEWMSKGTLEQMLQTEALAPARAVEIAQAVLSALGEAHRLGIIHRDVKPANVLFDDAGVTRLGDFGVAHLSDLSATATAGVIGTLGYMSPEQREGRPATVKSDIFGVGAILWEMLTGEKPDGSANPTEKVRPSGVHRDLGAQHDAVVFALVSDDAAARPEDTFAARKALSALRWPSTIERATAPRTERKKASERPSAIRLVPDTDGSEIDQWLGRHVISVPLNPRSLERASAFARADHPALQTVLRVDRAGSAIWLGVPQGAPLSAPPNPAQLQTLREALESLHAAGAAHGAIDPSHILVDDAGDVTLAFTDAIGPTATYDLDRIALARLAK